jgi:hypothetical protein
MHSKYNNLFSIWKLLIILLIALSVHFVGGHDAGVADTEGAYTSSGHEECAPNSHRLLPTLTVGATYQTTFEFPLIGDYIVTMKVVRENRASLDVDGGYPIRDYFQYKILHHDSDVADVPVEYLQFSVVLSEKLNSILQQFTVSLTEIQYDPQRDIVSAMVSILYALTFPIRLHRVAT